MTAPADETETQVPGRRPRLVVAALAVLALAAVVVLVAAAHVTPTGHGHPAASGGGLPTLVLTQPARPSASVGAPQRHLSTGSTVLGLVLLIAGALGVLAALAIIAGLLVSSLRRRSLQRRLTFASPGPEPSAGLVAQQVGTAVDRALRELRAGGAVDDAIIRCWLQLEAVTDEAGVARNPADTPEEAIERLFAAGRVQAGPLHVLADLYREARFSRHAMTEADVAAARTALTSIVDDLNRCDPAPAPAGSGADDAAR
jgi:hypothetical protein